MLPNLVILAALIGLTVVICVSAVVRRISSKNSEHNTYDWQPDLSHNIIYSERPLYSHRNNEISILLVEKSPEQRHEERRAYLREKNQ